jgi:hypothetical protein
MPVDSVAVETAVGDAIAAHPRTHLQDLVAVNVGLISVEVLVDQSEGSWGLVYFAEAAAQGTFETTAAEEVPCVQVSVVGERLLRIELEHEACGLSRKLLRSRILTDVEVI